MFTLLKNLFKKLGLILVLFSLPHLVFAQDLTRSLETTSAQLIPSTYIGYALVAFRLILGVLFLVAGMVGFRAGFNWLYWEGNAKKADENKKTLAKALFFITILFIIQALFRMWLGGDYTSLIA